ncbi:MAG TPA: oligosaccharide flippase family protein [Pyrinomonadaceae bacterium]|nr:oligosaccharide flippase family protein [Pyrinomonadaceae bacterium]
MSNEPTGRKTRIFKNGIYSALSWVFPIIFAFIVTPIVVQGLGDELYGLYAVIIGFISYSFTFGIGKTAAKYVSEYKATGEFDKISETVSAALWLSLSIGIVGAGIVALTADRLVSNVLRIPPPLHDTAIIAIYLAGLTILMTMLSQVFQYVLQGLQRFDRFVFLTNVSVFLLNLGSVAIVVYGYGVLGLLVWNLIVAGVMGAAFYLSARRMLPEFTFRFAIDRQLWRASVKYALSIIVYQVFANILLLFERFWVVRKFGTEALTFYVVPMMVGLYFHSFVSSLVLVLFPVFNELLADRRTLTRLYQTSTKIILTLAAFFFVTATVTGRVFLTVWMKGTFPPESYAILVFHAFTFGILSITVVVWQMNESHRLASLNAIVTIIWLAISAPLMVILSDDWGTIGVAFARLAGVVVFLALIIVAEKNFLGGVLFRFWTSMLLRLVAAAALTGFAECVTIGLLPSNWFALIVVGSLGLAVYVATLLALGFLRAGEREVLRDLILNWRAAK